MKLIYGTNDKPRLGQIIIFAIQQLLAIMAATLVVPVIINTSGDMPAGAPAMSSAAALFGAGVGTLVYQLFTRFKSPVFLGSSFAFIGSMCAAFAGAVSAQAGYLGLIIGAIVAGLIYVLIALVVKFVGVKWIKKLMPAVVIGPTVAIIGLSLAGNAIGDLQTVNFTQVETSGYTVSVSYNTSVDADGNAVYYNADGDVVATVADAEKIYTVLDQDGNVREDVTLIIDTVTDEATGETVEKYSFKRTPGSVYIAILCGLVTLAVTMLCATFGKKMIRLIPFIMGILAGYALAAIFTIIGTLAGVDALKVINFDPLINLFTDFGVKSIVSLPEFTFIEAIKGFKDIDGAYIGTIAVAYAPVALVVFAEHIADHKNLSSIIEQDLLEDPGLHNTLLGDGVGSMAGAFFGGCPNTTYGESVGCVAITGNASVVTIYTTALMAIAISFLSPFVAFVNTIPSCVMGGVCMALYGFIAVSGLKMIQKVDLEQNRNLFVVSTILITGIGGLTISIGEVTLTTVACALILGILANVMLGRKEKKAVEAAVVEEVLAENAPVEDAPVEDAPVEDTPVEDAPVEDTPVEDAPVEDTPVEDAPAEDAPVEDAPVEDAPVEDAPVEDAPVEDAPVEDAPADDQ